MSKQDTEETLIYAGIFAGALFILWLAFKKPVIKNRQDKIIPGNKLYQKDTLIISKPNSVLSQYPVFYVFGGIDYATPTWMEAKMPQEIKDRSVIVYGSYKTPFETMENAVYGFMNENRLNTKDVSIFGFSAGGQQVWKNAEKRNFKWVGGIDPTTHPEDSLKAKNNTLMVFNRNNWSGQYPAISQALPQMASAVVKAGGEAQEIKLAHKDIPAYFWNAYKEKILT